MMTLRPVRLVLTALTASALVVLLALSAVAAPKNGRGPSGAGDGSAALQVNPDPARAFVDEYHVTGCGLDPSALADIVVRMPTADLFFSVDVDADGCIDFTTMAGREGTYTIDAYQVVKGKKARLMASGSLDVVPSS